MKVYRGVQTYLHSSLTSASDRCEWSASRLGSFTPWKRTPLPTEQRLGGSQNQSGLFGEEKNLLPLLEFKPQVVKPIA
jgi:hypothetical protein